MGLTTEEHLEHYGVKGMHWGIRKADGSKMEGNFIERHPSVTSAGAGYVAMALAGSMTGLPILSMAIGVGTTIAVKSIINEHNNTRVR